MSLLVRRYRAAALVVLLQFLVACGGGPELRPLAADAVILAFGDSLTWGTGAARSAAYPAELERRIGRTVVNQGIPGEVSAAGAERLPAVLDDVRPQLLILIHGGNDFLRRSPRAVTRANLEAMITAARERDVDVVLLGVPGPNLTLSAPALYAEVAEAFAVPVDADTLPSLMRDRSVKSDSVHFNAEGYARLAEAVQALLEDHGALP